MDSIETESSPAEGDSAEPPRPSKGIFHLRPVESTAIGAVAGLVCVASGVSQYLQPYAGGNELISLGISIAVVAAGGFLLVALVRLVNDRDHKITIALFPALGALVVAGMVGGVAGHAIFGASGGRPQAVQYISPPSSASASAPTSRLPERQGTASTVTEVADNRNGVPVFASPAGASSNAPRIPFGTRVLVACFAPNESGIVSINAFYLVRTRPWDNVYAPADTFANGDPLGMPGSTNIDPAVPACPGT